MSTDDKNEDSIIKKVRTMLALADGLDNQIEADAFLAKANALLLKHNLELSTIVDDQQGEVGIGEEKEKVTWGVNKFEGRWETSLLSTLCYHNMCHCIIHTWQYERPHTRFRRAP